MAASTTAPVEDILPASSRSTRRFHLGKLQNWDATGGFQKTCHVELIDPRGASLSLLKHVETSGAIAYLPTQMSTPERIDKVLDLFKLCGVSH